MMVFLLALAQGMNNQLSEEIRQNGGADIMVYSVKTPAPDPHNPVINPTGVINESYAEILKNKISGIYVVSSALSVNGLVNKTQCTISGIEPDTFVLALMGTQNMISGTFLNSSNTNGVVLGKTLSDSLRAMVGDNVVISTATNKSQYFAVVGVFESASSAMNTRLYIRLDIAQNLSNEDGLVTNIGVKCTNPDEVGYVASMIPNEVSGVRVIVQQAVVEQATQLRDTVTVFVGAIGAVALTAGSFGVVNTTMMSMFERTREIGILKAVGARGSKILGMFWTEALLIGLLGGAVGCLTGIAATCVIPKIVSSMGGGAMASSISLVVTPTGIGTAFAIGVTVCVIAGLYPAWRAARMKTVEALRHD